jgi:hypothetical protein
VEKVGAKFEFVFSLENFICRQKMDATHDISPKGIRFSFVLISDMAPFQEVISLKTALRKKQNVHTFMHTVGLIVTKRADRD